VRRTPPTGALVRISAADPLNLAGIVTAGERIPSVASTRVIYRDGVPVAVGERQSVRPLVALDDAHVESIARVSKGGVGAGPQPVARSLQPVAP
jgi:ATP-dependent Lhr-like helicase